MKYSRFEDLPVWKLAAELAVEMFCWTEARQFRGKGDLANQLQRATLSISNNIAEGFERGTTRELIAYLYYARGSAGECRSMIEVILRSHQFARLHQEAQPLREKLESVSRQLRGWVNSLQNSEIKGQKYLNDESRARYERARRQSDFMDQQRAFRQEMKERLEREAAERAEKREG